MRSLQSTTAGGGTSTAGRSVVRGRWSREEERAGSALAGPTLAGRVDRGEIGIKGMRVGGKRTITVPWKFGYGAKGSLPSVPPKADLRFDVELLEVGAGFAV